MVAAAPKKRGIFSNMSTFVRWQLATFSVLTVIGLVVMAVVYVEVPAMFGIGRYRVTVQLAASGGLYPHSNVTYRGTEIGTVTDMRLTETGVDAELSLDSGYKVPTDITAAVRSVSAVGEQFVDLVPADGAHGHYLTDGAVIPQGRTELPQEVGPLLDRADRMVSGLNNTQLQAVIDLAFQAFNGTGSDLQRLLDSLHLFIQEADANVGPTKQLIDQVGPLLDTQRVSADSVRAWTANLAKVTDQLRAHDPQLRQIIEQGPGTIDVTNQLFENVQPSLPLVLANLTSIGQVTTTYASGIRQLLVIFPPLIRGLITAATKGPEELGVMANFAQFPAVNAPHPCLDGFLPANQWRSPAEMGAPPVPPGTYCHTSHTSPLDVRGARNNPCPNDPNRRGATPAECGLNFAYVPPEAEGASGAAAPNGANGTVQPSAFTPSVSNNSYDPLTGIFIGPDGRTYSQPGVARGGGAAVPATWQAMMIEQQGR